MKEKIKVYEEKSQRSSLWMWLLPLLLLAAMALLWMNRRQEGSGNTAAAPATDQVKPNSANDAVSASAWTADRIANSLLTSGRVSFNDADVHFATGSATLAGDSQAVLDQAAEALAGHSDWKIRVVGHTDDSGFPGPNKQLAQQRSSSVVAYLAAHGFPQSQLVTDVKGETEPAATNSTNQGRAENRRVGLIRQ